MGTKPRCNKKYNNKWVTPFKVPHEILFKCGFECTKLASPSFSSSSMLYVVVVLHAEQLPKVVVVAASHDSQEVPTVPSSF